MSRLPEHAWRNLHEKLRSSQPDRLQPQKGRRAEASPPCAGSTADRVLPCYLEPTGSAILSCMAALTASGTKLATAPWSLVCQFAA